MNFYVRDKRDRAVRKRGREVKLLSIDWTQFYCHKNGDKWVVTEARTGCKMAMGDTAEEARAKAERRIGHEGGEEVLKEHIQRIVAAYGSLNDMPPLAEEGVFDEH